MAGKGIKVRDHGLGNVLIGQFCQGVNGSGTGPGILDAVLLEDNFQNGVLEGFSKLLLFSFVVGAMTDISTIAHGPTVGTASSRHSV